MAQGCSDAGFCTMGAMRPGQDYNKKIPVKLRSIDLGFYEGQSNTSALIRAAIIDLGFALGKNYQLQFKTPYVWVNGNFGQTSGIGDLSLSLTRSIVQKPTYDIRGTIGAKIPTNRADLQHEEHEVVLPMYYQVSLGTFDLVAGGSFINKNWMLSVGYQQPLLHLNQNTFNANPSEWGWYDGGMNYVREHDVGRDLIRGADVMMRVERSFRMSRMSFNVGLLPIFRISKDQALNASGEYEKLEGTTGMALSALFGAVYRFNVLSSVKLIYGQRLTDRTYNPDGLTRKHVINFSYQYNF